MTRNQLKRLRQRFKPSPPMAGERTFYFHGQSLVTPNEKIVPEQHMTMCRGYEGHECTTLLDALTGVLEPRCPECYRRNIEIKKNSR